MDKITIHTCGKTFGKNGSGFSVILRSKASEWKRSFAYGNYSANQAEMLAVKFALLSVADSYKNTPITINSRNRYLRDMLEKDDEGYYTKVPKANKEILDQIRELIDTKKDITVVGDEDELSKECAKLTERAVKDGELVDIRK